MKLGTLRFWVLGALHNPNIIVQRQIVGAALVYSNYFLFTKLHVSAFRKLLLAKNFPSAFFGLNVISKKITNQPFF